MSRITKLQLPFPNPRTIEFGKTLRELRRSHGIQAYKVAEQLGWDNSLQTRMEQGKTHVPDPSIVNFMAEVIGLSEDEMNRLRLAAEYVPIFQKEPKEPIAEIRENLQNALSLVNKLEAPQNPHPNRERE